MGDVDHEKEVNIECATRECVSSSKRPAASMSHRGLAPKKRGLPPMLCPFVGYGPATANVACLARAASSRAAPPPKRQRAQWCARRLPRESRLRKVEVAAGTSHHSLAPKGRGLPPAQCTDMGYESIAASATWRARAASSRARVLPRDRQRSGARARATRKPAVRWRPQTARRTAVLHRRREASRRCSVAS